MRTIYGHFNLLRSSLLGEQLASSCKVSLERGQFSSVFAAPFLGIETNMSLTRSRIWTKHGG